MKVASPLLAAALSLVMLTGCTSNVETDASLDRFVRPPRIASSAALKPTAGEIKSAGPLAITFAERKIEMKQGIVVADDDGLLRYVFTADEKVTCDKPTPTKPNWLEFRLDRGPNGDFYSGQPLTPANVTFSVAGDPTATRDIPVSAARVAVSPLSDADPTVKLDMRKLFPNDPKAAITVSGAGSLSVTPCQSALDLFASGRPYDAEQGRATARFGDESFPLRSALAFVVDDGKNGEVVRYIGLFEQPEVSCEAADRAVSDKAGGVSGFQVQTSPVPIAASKKYGTATPIWMDGLYVVPGMEFFQERYLNQKSLRGYIRITAADLTDDPLFGPIPPETPLPTSTGVSGFLHLEGPEGRVSGSFIAAICRHPS